MTKPIYIGDKINLKIDTLSKEELGEYFKNFHIDKVQDEKISFRSFKTGENIIDLGENQINLTVASVLTPQDKNIFLNLSDDSNKIILEPNLPFIFIGGVFMLLISLFGIIKNLHKRKILSKIKPSEKCENILNNLSDNNFAFEISKALREYIDFIYQANFMSGTYEKIGKIDNSDIEFFKSLDFYKFSQSNSYDKNLFRKKSLEIFEKLKEEDKNV